MKTSFLHRHLLLVVLLLPFFVHAEQGPGVPDHLYPGGDGGPITANVPLNEVSVRAYRYFHKQWLAVVDEAWYKMDGQLMATFLSHSHLIKVFFNLKGAFLFNLEYYAGKDIATELSTMIRNKYPGCQIKVVTEVSSLDQKAYYITMENSALVRTISIVNGKMEVLSELSNGDGSISQPSGL